MNGYRGYDEWKTRSPGDQYAIDHPEKFRRGKYRVTVTRMLNVETVVEVEASSEEDARFDAVIAARELAADKWTGDDDYDTTDVEGPPEPDPDDARDDMQDREYNR